MPRRYNIHDVPKGKAKRRHAPTLTADMKRRAEHDSFINTCKLRDKLRNVRVAQVNGFWCHIHRNQVVASFDDVGAAVAAL